MFVTPRTYRLSQTSDESITPGAASHRASHLLAGRGVKSAKAQKAPQMLLLHQVGSLHVGEVVRYTISYSPSTDRILPKPSELRVKIRNTAAIPLRAAYLHGPYTLYASCYPADFDPNKKCNSCGTPQFEPNLRAGGSWDAIISLPLNAAVATSTPFDVRWIIEISSQILFSTSAEVPFELLIGRDKEATELGMSHKSALPPPGELKDFTARNLQGGEQSSASVAGVYSPALRLRVDDTTSLWKSEVFPSYHEKYLILTGQKREDHKTQQDHPLTGSGVHTKAKPRNVHLVVITHGLHSNLGADMLYLKESISKAANGPKRSDQERQHRQSNSTKYPVSGCQSGADDDAGKAHQTTGNDSMIETEQCAEELEEREEVVVCGFPGNVVRTERGIQYLGKRLAKYVLLMTYPDQPYLPEGISHSRHKHLARQRSVPLAEGLHHEFEELQQKYGYKITKISFVGHSLGGLIQTYALAYIQRHSPKFFDHIEPTNFIALASPFLGLSHENPLYVRFALDFGLVGRTGQDLGLAWNAPSKMRSGWDAMIGGLGGDHSQSGHHMEASSKPLLRVLPTGAAHEALIKFEKRTLYANVVNDGIVPLRTSSLLFLDWKGLQRVTKARRENGVVGTMAEWGWAELTGLTATARRQKALHGTGKTLRRNSDQSHSSSALDRVTIRAERRSVHSSGAHSQDSVSSNTWGKTFLAPSNPLSSLLAFFRLHNRNPQSKKANKIFKRSQTLPPEVTTEVAQASFANEHPSNMTDSLVRQANVDSNDHIPAFSDGVPCLPPRTTILEAAGDVLNPPLPSDEFILDPDSRPDTIFHDRIYNPCDIPPPPPARTRSFFGTSSRPGSSHHNGSKAQSENDETRADDHARKPSGMEVEEKIARAYHHDLSWRKVLVRLEPDAHNNIVVRRMFANAYGWPVIKHLVDNHFSDTDDSEAKERQPTKSADSPRSTPADRARANAPKFTDTPCFVPQRRMSDPGVYRNTSNCNVRASIQPITADLLQMKSNETT
ncbi:revertant of glycogen synthase kinase mutation [Ascosphaera apis ARSEF 7405]|uniref:Revertant of glycogen synthase kinase mutation n=1 Tax=Ascosphaera apis ARSEF 7405 TaxID=392613 RepID=A0A162HZG6_9EURO|nr:revertant of glycogen synthase kinase mutation [Ascosphaera apis ARSEF 7405]